MKKINIRLFFILSVFFILDIIKPLGYALNVEFLFLGIIFIALDRDITQTLILSLFFGLLKDLFISNAVNFSFIEFPIICLSIKQLLNYFSFAGKETYILVVRFLVPAIAIFIHITFNSIYMGGFVFIFSFIFFIQSFVFFFFIMKLLKKWVKVDLPIVID